MEIQPKNVNNPPKSAGILQRLYDSRRNNLGKLNTRNRFTMVYAITMITVLASAFAMRSRSIENWQKFAEGNQEIVLLSEDNFFYKISDPELIHCDMDCASRGYPSLVNQVKPAGDLMILNTGPRPPSVQPADAKKVSTWSEVQMTIPLTADQITGLGTDQLAIGLPALRYRQAFVFMNDMPWGRFLDSERIVVRAGKSAVLDQFLRIKIIVAIPNTGDTIELGIKKTPPYVATPRTSKNLEKFLLLQSDTRGAVMSIMSRILIAFFALFIFVVIDSTPESFGLSMFLGCEAVAIVLGERWIDVPYSKMFIHTFYQMGDIFRLFFFIQISRMFRPNTAYWLVATTLISIPYGYFRFKEVEWGISGLDVIPRFRDFTAGSLGTIFCLMALFSIRSENLPWRKAALILAAACSFQQIIGPLLHYFPEWNQSQTFRHFFTSYETLYTYLGTLSALTNISTLENRVSNLSQAKIHGDMIEQELSLGQTVQRSFLNIPKLPQQIELANHHEAAVYVSGDIYYAKWDRVTNKLAFLICDVTGHGVQAALKATACYMVAKNNWDKGISTDTDSQSRFDAFKQEQMLLMEQISETPDIPTFAAVEFDDITGTISSYKTNFNAPILIHPGPYGKWEMEVLSMSDSVSVEKQLMPGSLIALFSDGYVTGSRQLSKMLKYMSKHLAFFDGTPEGLEDIINAFDAQNVDRPKDDRTLLVMSWRRSEARYTSIKESEKDHATKSCSNQNLRFQKSS
ncbi:MAG: SpoIIE family protein phosphatase [Proteobacteria bacterium]|nr:SpoIIE family protein phosphatase [Pseudomonadota bacterium]